MRYLLPFLLLLPDPASAQVRVPELRITPELVYLGEFSASDAFDSSPNHVQLVATVRYSAPWRLALSLEGPFRRDADGHELPLDRVSGLWPLIPQSVLDGYPEIVTSGTGGEAPVEFAFDTGIVLDGIQAYLETSDPPGLYTTVVAATLLDSDGYALMEPVLVPFQFRLLGWSYLSFVPETMELRVLPGDPGLSVSEMYAISLTTNANWTIEVTADGDLVGEGSDIPIDQLGICLTPVSGRAYAWEDDCQSFGGSGVQVDGPPPECPSESIELGVVLQLRFEEMPPAGEYRATLRFVSSP